MVTTMPKQQGMMMGPMRGHLAPNSSPFKVTTNKLSSQYMIQDHMSNHYTKLGTAKAAIDNKPPRSMATSVKKRDQMRREAMAKQMKLFDFEKEMKHGSTTPHRQTPDSSMYGSQRLFSVTVSKSGYDEPRPQSVSSFRSGRMSPRPRSASSPRSMRSDLNSPRDKSKKPDILTQTYGGDYLDRHEERFKNVDAPFAPRLKKRPGKSYLSQSKHYAPPLVMNKERQKKEASKSRKKSESGVSPTSSASDLEGHETPASRASEDRFNAMKTKERQSDLTDSSLIRDSRVTYDNIYPEQRSYDAYGFRHAATNDTFFGRSSLGRSFSRNEFLPNETKSRIEAEEEEMKYLEFINSVTNDILTRGIYSDRVLTQVMQRHLDQNRGRLNEGRMRHMLMKLQEDLGVSSDVTLQGFSSTSKYDFSYDGSSTTGSGRRSRSRDRDKHSESETHVSRKLSNGKTPSKKSEEKLDGKSSDGSDGRESSLRRRGILRTPATSSGSDLDMKAATFSSGDEDDKLRSKKVTIVNGSKQKVESTATEKGDETGQAEVVKLVSELDLNEQDNTRRSDTEAISPPKPAKRSSVGSDKTKSILHSLDGDQLIKDDSHKSELVKKEYDLDSDLDGF